MDKCKSLFNIFGLSLDLVGIILLLIHGRKIMGLTTPVDEEHLGAKPWCYVGFICIIIGFIAQIIGNIISLLYE